MGGCCGRANKRYENLKTLTKAEEGSLAEAICQIVCSKSYPDKYMIEEAKTLFKDTFTLDRMTHKEFDESNFNRILMSCGSLPAETLRARDAPNRHHSED